MIADAPTTRNCEFRATSTTLQALRTYWNRCSNNDEWFHRLWDMHTSHTRHYHTAVHLLEMCELLDIVASTEQIESSLDTTSMLLAIFFHDAVYDAKSKTNEEDSAELFSSFAKTVNLDPLVASKVSNWILATKTHQPQHSAVSDDALSLQLFLDLDMAVLGKTAQAYAEYARLIRCEYSFVPLDTYCTTRAKVLELFLQQPTIYGNDHMRNALEVRARDNLASEIQMLRTGIIPGCKDR